MRDSIYRITLDVHDTSSQALLDIKKNDSSRQIKFTLMDGGKPYTITNDCTAVFRAKKPDGTILYNNCTIADNVITYTLTNQTSAAVGILECEVTLYGSDSKQITSPRFTMRVEDNLYSDSEIESEDEFTQLAQAISGANNLNISASKSGSTATITLTKKNGTTQTVTVSDGQNGQDGQDGEDGADGADGFSPSASVSKVGTKATITITDKDGTTTAEINDGAKGAKGDTGERGEKGDTGSPGAKGDTGEKGEKGDTGTFNSVTASVDANTGTPSVDVTYSSGNAAFAFHNLKGNTGANGADGQDGQDGEDGTDGRGITSITKTGTVGKIDTYTITYTDGTTSTFTVANGQDGEGKGIESITKTSTVGKVDTYTITYTDATTTTFTVTNGNDGTDGKGIASISKTGTVGKVDTYTITYTDTTTTTFTVTNGNDGTNGTDGSDGISVSNATINSSGHLVVTLSNGTTIDTGVAKGTDGVNGQDGDDGVSVTGVVIDSSGHLIVTLSSGSSIDAGMAKGAKGDTGDSGVYIGTTPPTDPDVRVWIDTSGSAGDVEMTTNKVTSTSGWSATTNDTRYPSEKLVKDSLDGKAASSHSHSTSDITGLTATVAELNVLDGISASTAELNVLDGITASTTELNYVDGVTSNIQTQLDGKQNTLTIDLAPTSGSTNPVTSGGVYTALATKQDVITSNTDLTVKTLTGGITYLTSAPLSNNADGLLIVYLQNEPSTKYSGYLYLIAES